MNRKALVEQIKRHEGYSERPYQDTRGFWTVGWGHLIHHTPTTVNQFLGDLLNAICSESMHKQWLKDDIERAELDASTWLDMESLSDARQRMAVEMCFVLGGAGARKFKNFKAAVERGDHHQASKELVNSLWHSQAPSRVSALAEQWAEG